MKKIIIPIIFLTLLSCVEDFHLDFDFNPTTTVVKLQSNILGEHEEVYVYFAVTFITEQPPGGIVIIERSIGDSTNFIPIDTLEGVSQYMYYTDNDSLLQANGTAYYKLGYLEENEVEYFKSVTVNIPGSQHFYQPASDTVGDTLQIAFAQVPNFGACSLAIYQGHEIAPESLLSLVDPLFDTSLTYPDTTLVVYMADSIFPDTMIYTIKISSSVLLPLITDTSVGFRAFFKKP